MDKNHYQCNFISCKHNTNDTTDMLDHIFINHSLDACFNAKCFMPHCFKHFKYFKQLENHVKKFHSDPNVSKQFKIVCDRKECGKILDDMDSLYRHYYHHIKEIESTKNKQIKIIKCFYKNCNYELYEYKQNTVHLFRNHLSRMHAHVKEEKYLKNELLVSNCHSDDERTNDYMDYIDFENNEQNQETSQESSSETTSTFKIQQNISNFEQYYMKLYLKLKDKYLIAQYKCDEIFEDINKIIKLNNSNTLDLITHCKSNYESSKVLDIIENNINNENTLFENVHARLKYDSAKNQWMNNSGYFVQPVPIELSPNSSYQMIPIRSNLKALLSHPEIQRLYFESNQHFAHNTVKSFKDTENFKNNQLYKNDPNSFQLVIYNDDFDTSNPLGDNRKENVINATYFRLGNIDSRHQSVDYFTQVILLCDSQHVKQYGYPKIFEPMINEIKLLETEGIDIVYNGHLVNLKGTISFISADNLAANGIGGFVESFQSKISEFFFLLCINTHYISIYLSKILKQIIADFVMYPTKK